MKPPKELRPGFAPAPVQSLLVSLLSGAEQYFHKLSAVAVLMMNTEALVNFIQTRFEALADPGKAPQMAAYMKTDMPFYGIQKPERIPVYREMRKLFRPDSQDDYEHAVLALWALPHREEKYAAIEYACLFTDFVSAASLPLYDRLIREGAWWDFVDSIAIPLVGLALMKERPHVRNSMYEWVGDPDMWIRRAALLSQNHHKKDTDEEQLFDHCLRLAHESEFFIRKAIGWALREYSYSSPNAVKDFLLANKEKLSPLTFKEGARGLARKGLIVPTAAAPVAVKDRASQPVNPL